jgi:hypothetical protein
MSAQPADAEPADKGTTPFPVWDPTKETFLFLWAHKFWFLTRALLPAVLASVTFIVTFTRLGFYAVWEVALFLVSALFLSNMLVSSHRRVVLGDPCTRFTDFLPRVADLTYFGLWLALTIVKWALDFVGAFLASMVALAGQVFDLGASILFFLILVRLIALFPLVAIRAKTPFRTAWKLSEGQVGRLVVFSFVVGIVLIAALGAVAALVFYSQAWLAPNLEGEGITDRVGELYTTLPFFIGALFLMLELEVVGIAQSVAYRRLAKLKPVG